MKYIDTNAVKLRIKAILPMLNEYQRRRYLSAEAKFLGRDGIHIVEQISGVSQQTLMNGIKELGYAEAEIVVRVISKRHNAQDFRSNGSLDDSTIKSLIDSARKAPSAKNRQPWKFRVVNEKAKIIELSNTITELNTDDSGNTAIDKNSITALRNASTVLFVMYDEDSKSEYRISDYLSVGACVENLIIQATAQGIASFWMCDIPLNMRDSLKELFQLPFDFAAVILLGKQENCGCVIPEKMKTAQSQLDIECQIVAQVISKRHSTRNFKSDVVLDEPTIKSLIDATEKAPSAENRQPCKFHIINDKEEIIELSKKMTALNNDGSGRLIIDQNSIAALRNASTVLFVLYDNDDNPDYKSSDYLFIGACVENLIIQATAQGIDSLWMGDPLARHDELKEYLELPFDFVSVVLLGEQDYCKCVTKKSLEEICIWD